MVRKMKGRRHERIDLYAPKGKKDYLEFVRAKIKLATFGSYQGIINSTIAPYLLL